MNPLLFPLAALPSTAGLVQLLIYAAIAALIIWGIVALVRWSGIPIPQPVWIILTVLVGVFCIVWLARLFGYAV